MTQTFKQYCDAAEAFGCDSDLFEARRDWLVTLTRTRDSNCLDESNFAAALKSLGGESETVEVQRFGHWACGWVEHIFVHPSRASEVTSIEGALADYPVLDDNDFSERELESASLAWDQWGCKDFVRELCRVHHLDPMGPVADLLMSNHDWTLYAFEDEVGVVYREGEDYHTSKHKLKALTRDEIAKCVRIVRTEARKAK